MLRLKQRIPWFKMVKRIFSVCKLSYWKSLLMGPVTASWYRIWLLWAFLKFSQFFPNSSGQKKQECLRWVTFVSEELKSLRDSVSVAVFYWFWSVIFKPFSHFFKKRTHVKVNSKTLQSSKFWFSIWRFQSSFPIYQNCFEKELPQTFSSIMKRFFMLSSFCFDSRNDRTFLWKRSASSSGDLFDMKLRNIDIKFLNIGY